MNFRRLLLLVVALLSLSVAGCQPTVAYGRRDVRPVDTRSDEVAHASSPEAADADL